MPPPLPHPVQIWQRVDELLDTTPDLDRLRYHGLDALAAHRRHALGLAIGDGLRDRARSCLSTTLAGEAALDSIVESFDAPVVVFKGLELASRYRYPASRPFGDLDLITAEPERLQQHLLDTGWTQPRDHESYAARHHHLAGLWHRGFRISLEVHRHPAWEIWLHPPDASELVDRSRPIPGQPTHRLGLHPRDNFIATLVHAWRGNRFVALRDLLDVALVANDLDFVDRHDTTDRYNAGRLWNVAALLIDWKLGSGEPPPRAIRALAPNLERLDTDPAPPSRRLIGLPWVAPPLAAVSVMTREIRARRMIHVRELDDDA